MVVGSKLIFSWSKNANETIYRSQNLLFLSPNYTIAAMFLKTTTQSLLRAVFKMTNILNISSVYFACFLYVL